MKLLSLTLLATALLTTTAMAAPSVVASIKPVHSLVAAVMAGVGEPTLIVKGSASPHTYALRPSDAGALEAADIVFWTGHGMELFLGEALETLATSAKVVELADSPGIELLPVREGGAFEAHSDGDEAEHDDEHDEHEEHGEGDMHFWLDPENAKLMVTQIATTLAEADPDNATAYQANAEAELVKLDALEAELAAMLAPVGDKPFIVFHDAYQYFEARFGLNLAGSVTVTPDAMPGAARIDELKARLAELDVTCVFAEPNFEPAIISAITEGTPAKSGVLDPEGGALAEGVELYPELLRGLATSLVDCLG
ncbi:zinc ABC transporter substrate-binding protein [Devosia sp.]|uniref:zinc ABC transporter substrate-binding protein n=1 Tax=Devosia sp. TaxID=1871048 RepID=UPI002FCC727C